jgi:aromatic ring-opening dioxygenase catalytic subunit (LigB family)
MGKIVGAFTASHAPGLTGFPDRADPRQRAAVDAAFTEVRLRVQELDPDAVIAVSVEHFTNFFLSNLPAFAIATADSYLGPVTAEMAAFLRVDQRQYPGHAALGEYLYRFALESDFDPAMVAGELAFDENFCVPLEYIDPGSRLPLVPIILNGVNPPCPNMTRCYDFGRMIKSAVQAQNIVERVVVLGTGGLSHWVGMAESGQVNEVFDRDFLRRMESGDRSRLTDYSHDQIEAAGNGAHEVRAWLVIAGAAGVPFETLAYQPVPEWLTGTAIAAARL